MSVVSVRHTPLRYVFVAEEKVAVYSGVIVEGGVEPPPEVEPVS